MDVERQDTILRDALTSLKKLNAETILSLNNPISWKLIHYPIVLHHCCNIIVDYFYMINK